MSTSTSGKVMQELIKNEEKYIKTLKVLKQCFLTPLKYAQDEPVRNSNTVILFSMLEQIRLLNQKFCEVLRKSLSFMNVGRRKYQNQKNILHIAGIFVQMVGNIECLWNLYTEFACHIALLFGPMIGMYGRYARLQPRVMSVLRSGKSANKEFSDKLDELAEKAKHDLFFFLERPLSRVRIYSTKLSEIVTNDVDPEGEAYGAAERAIDMLRRSALGVAESRKMYHREKLVLELQNRFKSSEIFRPGRILLKETKAIKISKHNNRKEYVFLLFNDVFMYGTGRKIHGCFSLAETAVEEVTKEGKNCSDSSRTLGICTIEKSFMIEFSSSSTCEKWGSKMKNAIKTQRLLRRGSIERPQGLQRIWDQNKTCTLCSRSIGGIFKRMFHCHFCGETVCGKCSSTRTFFHRRISKGNSEAPRRSIIAAAAAGLTRSGSVGARDSPKNAERVCNRCLPSVEEENHSKRKSVVTDDISIISPQVSLHHMEKFSRQKLDSVDWKISTEVGSSARSSTYSDRRISAVTEYPETPRRSSITQPKKHGGRYEIAKELLDTEMEYVDNIRRVVRLLVRPTIFKSSTGEMATLPDEAILFLDGMEQIYVLNLQFLQDLQRRVDTWYQQQPLGELIMQFTTLLDIYESYLGRYHSIMKVLADKKWTEWFSKLQDSLETTSIEEIFLLPIRRLEKYQASIKKLLTITPKLHQDYSQLKDALRILEPVSFWSPQSAFGLLTQNSGMLRVRSEVESPRHRRSGTILTDNSVASDSVAASPKKLLKDRSASAEFNRSSRGPHRGRNDAKRRSDFAPRDRNLVPSAKPKGDKNRASIAPLGAMEHSGGQIIAPPPPPPLPPPGHRRTDTENSSHIEPPGGSPLQGSVTPLSSRSGVSEHPPPSPLRDENYSRTVDADQTARSPIARTRAHSSKGHHRTQVKEPRFSMIFPPNLRSGTKHFSSHPPPPPPRTKHFSSHPPPPPPRTTFSSNRPSSQRYPPNLSMIPRHPSRSKIREISPDIVLPTPPEPPKRDVDPPTPINNPPPPPPPPRCQKKTRGRITPDLLPLVGSLNTKAEAQRKEAQAQPTLEIHDSISPSASKPPTQIHQETAHVKVNENPPEGQEKERKMTSNFPNPIPSRENTSLPPPVPEVTALTDPQRQVTAVTDTQREVTAVTDTQREVTAVTDTRREVTAVTDTQGGETAVTDTQGEETAVTDTQLEETATVDTQSSVQSPPEVIHPPSTNPFQLKSQPIYPVPPPEKKHGKTEFSTQQDFKSSEAVVEKGANSTNMKPPSPPPPTAPRPCGVRLAMIAAKRRSGERGERRKKKKNQ